jgi:hypothetical protein
MHGKQNLWVQPSRVETKAEGMSSMQIEQTSFVEIDPILEEILLPLLPELLFFEFLLLSQDCGLF